MAVRIHDFREITVRRTVDLDPWETGDRVHVPSDWRPDRLRPVALLETITAEDRDGEPILVYEAEVQGQPQTKAGRDSRAHGYRYATLDQAALAVMPEHLHALLIGPRGMRQLLALSLPVDLFAATGFVATKGGDPAHV
jgi:hypothetical protein